MDKSDIKSLKVYPSVKVNLMGSPSNATTEGFDNKPVTVTLVSRGRLALVA